MACRLGGQRVRSMASRLRSMACALGTTILTITDDGGGNCLITTAAPHGLEGTPPITVSGNSVAGYNVEHSVDSIPSTTTLVTNQAYTEDGTGGTWALA